MLRAMRAAVIRQFGGPDVVKYETDFPKPSITTPNQILIRVHAAGVNPVDTYIRSGTYGALPETPFVTGKDGAGIVEEVGIQVADVKPGDRVWFAFSNGSYAEYCTTTSAFQLPSKINFEQGASLGTPYCTAHRALFDKAKVKPGDQILIHGASGAVGLAAIQLARSAGCTVIGTAGTEDGLKLIKEMGVEFAANHRAADYQQILSEKYPKGFNVILEMLANVNLQRDLELVAVKGTIVVIGSRGPIEIQPRLTMMKECIVTGMALQSASKEELAQSAKEINDGIEKGVIKPVVAKRFPLDKAGDAQREVIENKGTVGKIVITID